MRWTWFLLKATASSSHGNKLLLPRNQAYFNNFAIEFNSAIRKGSTLFPPEVRHFWICRNLNLTKYSHQPWKQLQQQHNPVSPSQQQETSGKWQVLFQDSSHLMALNKDWTKRPFYRLQCHTCQEQWKLSSFQILMTVLLSKSLL